MSCKFNQQLRKFDYGPAETFDAVWQMVVSSLVPGGRFVGQLFGPDHYKGSNDIVRRTPSEIDAMLAGLEVQHLEEFRDEIRDIHYFEIIARKPSA